MLISGEKVQLRPFSAADFENIVAWGNDKEVSRYLDGDYPTSIEECPIWLQRANSDRHAQLFAIAAADSGRVIGDIELDHITWRSGDAELRIRIGDKARWNMGYGTDAVTTLLQHAFVQMNLSRVYLRVFSANKGAIRCYEKAGFRKEGRLTRQSESGEMREIMLMRILKREFERKADRMHGRQTA